MGWEKKGERVDKFLADNEWARGNWDCWNVGDKISMCIELFRKIVDTSKKVYLKKLK